MAVGARVLRWLAPWGLAAGLLPAAMAGPAEATLPATGPGDARSWLGRIHAAANGRNYQGTMVFSAGGVMSSSRVAHFCVGEQVFERIEALDGKPRQVYRHNDLVHTVWPQAGMAVIERRSLQANLPSATQSVDPRALEQYELRPEGRERIAGRDAFVFLLHPRDEWRFAQRIWADHDTGLMLRSDVIGPARAVLESTAFSEVEIGVRAQPDSVLQPIRKLESLRVLRPAHVPTQLEAQGWSLTRPVAGFRLASCVRRPADLQAQAERAAAGPDIVQAVFSDGLTHVSLFIEPFDAARHRKDLQAQFGATHSLAGRKGDAWVTAMGDVPAATLKQFFEALERRP
jgi:sigma-E factor negative regulatory protein RseB